MTSGLPPTIYLAKVGPMDLPSLASQALE